MRSPFNTGPRTCQHGGAVAQQLHASSDAGSGEGGAPVPAKVAADGAGEGAGSSAGQLASCRCC